MSCTLKNLMCVWRRARRGFESGGLYVPEDFTLSSGTIEAYPAEPCDGRLSCRLKNKRSNLNRLRRGSAYS
jgi:hypothetical protein